MLVPLPNLWHRSMAKYHQSAEQVQVRLSSIPSSRYGDGNKCALSHATFVFCDEVFAAKDVCSLCSDSTTHKPIVAVSSLLIQNSGDCYASAPSPFRRLLGHVSMLSVIRLAQIRNFRSDDPPSVYSYGRHCSSRSSDP